MSKPEETPRAKTKRRKEIMEAVDIWADMNEVSVLCLGTSEDRHEYADAIVGTVLNPRPAVVYLRELVILAFMEMEDWTYEDAQEWYDYNTARGVMYMGDDQNPPMLVDELMEM